jgi:hypothetical protein
LAFGLGNLSSQVPGNIVQQLHRKVRLHYEAGLAAETFRCLASQHFVREFPQYRSAATKLEKARDYADGQFQDGA